MPPPTTVPVLAFEQGQPISNISISLDATILRPWRDSSALGTADPHYPYYAMELQISGWRSPAPLSNNILARYTGGKLKKDALYQLVGRFVVDTSREGGRSYLHVDEAVRFQGPGTIRSFKQPLFLLVAEVVQVLEVPGRLVLRWVTRDPYRRDMLCEQSAVVRLEKPLQEKDRVRFTNELCCLEGRMEGLDHRKDWTCVGIKLC